MKKMLTVLLLAAVTLTVAVSPAQARRFQRYNGPKYVFLFIGDGMASPQIHATEAYLHQSSIQADDPDGDLGDGSLGTAGAVLLNMSQLPVVGLQMSYADNRFITGSAAAATALSSGHKTSIGTIAMAPDHSVDYTTIAELAKQKGMKVGVISSVSIDHATPACYYAHQTSRNYYWAIANELSESGFDYFAGGGMKGERVKDGLRYYYNGESDPNALPENDPIQHAIDNGYTVITNKTDLMTQAPGSKVFAYSKDYMDGSWALPYEMDRPDGDVSLAEYTAEGIRLLDNNNGFFMMIEGGKIDWACHANDAKAALEDTVAFDDAVAEAIEFYNEHPNDTLIVVTGDHECGGLTLGFAGTEYDTAYEVLAGQTMSYEMFDWTLLKEHKEDPNTMWASEEDDMDDDIKDKIATAFGLVYDELTPFQQRKLEEAYDDSMGGRDGNPNGTYEEMAAFEEEGLAYGYYEPLTVTCTHIMNNLAGFAFTSYSHTGVPVPVFAQGREAYRFDGKYENTEVAVRIAEAMRVQNGLTD